jgi:predicted RNase H-like nuclease
MRECKGPSLLTRFEDFPRKRKGLRIAGVDGCKGGWVAVCELNGGLQVQLWPDISPLFQAEWDMVMIDIPIGLSEHGRRPCDNEARTELGPKRSSVFFAPTRSQVSATSYEEVRVQGVSLQSFYLFGKIREVDEALAPSHQSWFREAHPELAYHIRSDKTLSKKRTETGRKEREEILDKLSSPFRLSDWESQFLRKHVGTDDLLDAAILLEVARDSIHNSGRCVGGENLDSRGLKMEIWF